MFEMSFLFWMSTTFLILQVLPELLKNQVKIYNIPHPEFPYPPSRAASPVFSKWTDFPFILWACPTWNLLGYLYDCGLCRNLDELSYSGSQCHSHLEDVEMVLHFQSRFGYSLFGYLIVASYRLCENDHAHRIKWGLEGEGMYFQIICLVHGGVASRICHENRRGTQLCMTLRSLFSEAQAGHMVWF